jgi:hypothetical protein
MDPTTIIFFLSLALLFLPGSLLYSAATRERLSEKTSSRFRLLEMSLTWQNWFDLGRAYLAGAALMGSSVLQGVGATRPGFEWMIAGTIFAVAVVLQTIHYRGSFYFSAPVFFVWGVTLALVDPIPALFAIIFSTIFTRMVDHIDLKFPLLAMVLGVAGYLTEGFSLQLAVACVIVPIPLIVAYASMGNLLCCSRLEPLH